MNTDHDKVVRQMTQSAHSIALSQRERVELARLRNEVRELRELQQTTVAPPEIELRLAAPLTATSGGIQYQVELTLRQ